jgi:urea transport system substrate-binding protein
MFAKLNQHSGVFMANEKSKADPLFQDARSSPSSRTGDTMDSGAGMTEGTEPPLNLSALLSPPTNLDELGWLAHYRVLEVIGRGGMGVVFRAEDSHLRRIVALKVILPEYAAHQLARDRFLREARASAAVKSDHVVTIYQVGQDNDTPYLAMEFLEGETLESRLKNGGPIPIPEVCRIGREAAAGLAAAHAQGLIHRDIKPANIWLEAKTGRVKLLDFGLARVIGGSTGLTRTGNIVGTPDFMSPEQGRGEELDARSDLFSLGSVLYTMCSGQVPFPGSSTMAVLTALAVKTPKPILEINPNVPADLVTLIEALLQKDPANRPSSTDEVGEALAALESGLPPNAEGALPNLGSGIRRLSSPRIPSPGPDVVSTVVTRIRSPKSGRIAVLGGISFCAIVAIATMWFLLRPGGTGGLPSVPTGPSIRIGVLHSRTGTMAISERPVIDTVLMAVEEINAQGGLLGRPVEVFQPDGESDETVFARQAEKLIQEDKVCAIFGCWTSASRKAVVPVVEKHDHLLFYPIQYEGMEQSPNVVYLGPVPNQQILPALRWMVGFEGKKRWFLVGSDYVFPRTANEVIRDEAKARGCTIVGEEYLLLGSADTAGIVKKIAETRPDLIVNTINGDSNVAFFRALRQAGITSKQIPTMSFSISVQELSVLGSRHSAGDYLAATYFETLDNPENRNFARRFRDHYGAERLLSDAMETAYVGVYLWAKAVQKANTEETRVVRETVKGLDIDTPQGAFRIDPNSLHTTQTARIGRIDESGQLREVYLSPQPILPEPFPASRSREEWTKFVHELYERWGGHWSNPGR